MSLRLITITLAASTILLGEAGNPVAQAQGQADPSVILLPSSGPPGTQVQVRGRAFSDTPCGVKLFLDDLNGPLLGIAGVEAGQFLATVVIPLDTSTGGHPIIAQGLVFSGEFCGGPSGDQGSALFTVTSDTTDEPRITISAIDGTPGSVVEIRGSGFCGAATCSPVTILFSGLPGAQDVEMMPDGTFVVLASVPGGSPIGDTPISAQQMLGDGSMINAYGELGVWIKPDTGPAGGPGAPVVGAERDFFEPWAEDGDEPITYGPPSAVTDVNPDGLPGEPRYGGRCMRVTISPTNKQNAFTASELGGLFRSSNGGGNWSHVDDVPLTLTRDVLYDPRDANIVIAAGRYDGRVANNGGIWRSTDGGATWAKPAGSNPSCSSEASAWAIAIPDDAVEHVNVFVGTDCGVAISDDSGATWTHVDPCTSADTAYCGNGGTIFDVEARVVGGNIQVDVCGAEGFFRSDDGGVTWSTPDPNSPCRTAGVPAAMRPINPCNVATAPGDPDTVYLANWSGATPDGFCTSRLVESTSGGAPGSWVDMNITRSNCRDAWVVTDPALSGDPDLYEVYFGDSQRVRHQTCDLNNDPRCTTGNASWPEADSGAHSDPSDIAFDPTTNGCPMILSTDGGISTSDDCGASWVDGNRGLHALDLVGGIAGTVQAASTDIYVGTQDNGMYMTLDGAASWSRPQGADVYNVLADHDPPARVLFRKCFGCSNSIAGAGLAGNAAFNDPPGDVPTTARVTQFGSQRYAMITSDSPACTDDGDCIALGGTTCGNDTAGECDDLVFWTVYVTTDEGGSWTQMGPSPLPGRPGEIKASGPSGSPTFYLRLNVGGNLRIYKLSGPLDNTATWALANSGLSVPTGAWDVHPTDPSRLYGSDVGTDQMMFSTNGGLTWNPDTALTNLVTRSGEFKFDSSTFRSQASAVAFDANSDTIMVGTRTAGMLVSVTGGKTWDNVPGAEALPLARDFFFDESGGTIYAATRGRGIWLIDLPEVDVSVQKDDDPDPVNGGDNLVYTITVTNAGPDIAHDVQVVDILPPDTTYINDTFGCVEGPIGTLTCDLGDLPANEPVEFDVTVLVTACPPGITNRVTVTTTDPDPNLDNDTHEEFTVVLDVTPPVITCDATGGEVDENCEYLLPFTATVTDECCVNTADVDVTASVPTANATLGPVNFVPQQVNEQTVTLNGTVLVSDLTSCPATVLIKVDADDCSGNAGEQCQAQADVVDLIPPEIACPDDITLARGDKICTDDVQNWLDSTTATDNCDTDVDIVDDSASNGFACGFPYGTSTLVTWTATDDCGNTADCGATITIKDAPRISLSEKGSFFILPRIELRYDAFGNVLQDTFITLTNDYNISPDVIVQLFFVSGDSPTWEYADTTLRLTPDQPAYWSTAEGRALSGLGLGFDVLGPPIPAPDGSGDFVLRGYIFGFAMDGMGQSLRWNHLFAEATIVNYIDGTAWSYHALTAAARCEANNGDPLQSCIDFDSNGVCCDADIVPGWLGFDGFQYDFAFNQLLFHFFAVGSEALTRREPLAPGTTLTTDLTLVPLDGDFSVTDGVPGNPVTTLASFVIFNENENKKTNTKRCITCWDQTLLADYDTPNWFLLNLLGTDMGRASINGVASNLCNSQTADSQAAALSGVIAQRLAIDAGFALDCTGYALVGNGFQAATLQVDVHGGISEESPDGIDGDIVPPNGFDVVNEDRATIDWQSLEGELERWTNERP